MEFICNTCRRGGLSCGESKRTPWAHQSPEATNTPHEADKAKARGDDGALLFRV
jgi:hypothetical protein